jgi:hypothetical protein
MALTPEQRRVLAEFKRAIRDTHATRKPAKALLEAGQAESSLRNLSYGDRDSLGPLQQRPSQGWKNARDPYLAARDFLAQAIPKAGKYATAGQLAQAVQRSAYPGRYDAHSRDANALLGGTAGASPSKPAYTAPGSDSKTQIALSLLGMGSLSGGYGGGDPLTMALLQAKQQSSAPVAHGPQPTGSDIHAVVARAKQIDSEHLPYKWGGGHGGKPAGKGVPVDCSGAVSRLLGVSPRVSGQFEKFGQAGKGKSLTIYANGHHVLMEINGHFWGTSSSNPQGGAGWIPRSAISPQYLKGFVARHQAGM